MTIARPGALTPGRPGDRARAPGRIVPALLPRRRPAARVRRADPAGAQRDRGDRARRRQRGQPRSPGHRAGGAGRGRGVPRRQRRLPAGPPVRPGRGAAGLRRGAGRPQAGLGRAVAAPVRRPHHHRLPVHPRRAHGHHADLRPGRLPAAPVHGGDRVRGGDLGELRLPHRAAGRPGLRGPAVGGPAAGAGTDRRDQRADRGGAAGLGLAPPGAGAAPRAGARAAAGRPGPGGRPGRAEPDRAGGRPVTGAPVWAWAVAGCVILGLLAVDLAANRGQPTMRRAVLVSAGWVAAAVVFGGILIAWQGGGPGQEYFTAYLVEKALSIDNVFVFALLFQAFAVPAAYQHRVLFAGIAGALALRAGFIAAGATMLEHLSWAGYLFGVL